MSDPQKKRDPAVPVQRIKHPDRKRKISRPVTVLLNVVIVSLIATGLFLILQPYYLHWQQDRKTAELMKSLKEGDGTIVLFQDDLVVPGEEEEFVDQIEDWGEPTVTGSDSSPSATAGSDSVPTASQGSDPSQASSATAAGGATTTVKPAPKPTPKPIVIKAIGQIIIDKIDLTMPIADRAESAQLRVAVGLLGGSSLPGAPGNTIILGHRMYTYGRHFNRLNEVVAGDSIVIVTKERRLTYQVERQTTILPAELRPTLSAYTTEKQLILVTCTPVRVASHRLLVYAKLISDTPL